ncbi:Strictosidine synthase [Quillaja saponaria]|uniref:Strictosidine synthase n=1 Tax=Quillaja saponaria TaxID=32244 RepID=A0AAD7Q894_QUISA|nr:Strictosidine synthase [Quillaja saponaria]
MSSSTRVFFTAAIVVVFVSAIFAYNRIGYSAKHVDIEKSFNNKKLWQYEVVPIEDAVGPESISFDPLGSGPYTGVSDGRIIKWLQNEQRWINFAVTSPGREGCRGPYDHHDQMEHICGRPLGLCFGQTTGDLYIADAYMGLLVVGHNGGIATRVLTQVQGIPLGFTNSLDIDQTSGAVYYSDSSSQYQRRRYISLILSGDKTGRLMKYDPQSKRATVLVDNLSFPNGVALSENSDYILLAETTNCRVLRYWLQTHKAGTLEVFADQLPGFPDNIKRSPRGGFWVGIHVRKKRMFQWVLSYPWIGNALLNYVPVDIMKAYSYLAKFAKITGMAIRVNEQGDVVEIFEDTSGIIRWKSISEVEERNGTLWVGSINMPFVGKYYNFGI